MKLSNKARLPKDGAVRLVLAGALLAASAAECQSLIQPLYPSSKAVCDEAYRRNHAIVEAARVKQQECQTTCANAQSRADSGSYGRICGGIVRSSQVWLDGSYSQCMSLKKHWIDLQASIKETDRRCNLAVDNRRAADTVLNASQDDSSYPEQLGSTKSAAEDLNSRVSTGNDAVDKYRAEVQRRGPNAAASLQADALNNLRQSNVQAGSPSLTGVVSGGSRQSSCSEFLAQWEGVSKGLTADNAEARMSAVCGDADIVRCMERVQRCVDSTSE